MRSLRGKKRQIQNGQNVGIPLEVSMLPSLSRVPTLRERGNYRSDKKATKASAKHDRTTTHVRKYLAERFIRSLEFDTVGFRGFSFAFIGQFASKVAE